MATATGAADLAGGAEGVEVLGGMAPGFDGILTPEALGFVAGLHRSFDPRRRELLRARIDRQAAFDAGARPDFLAATASVMISPACSKTSIVTSSAGRALRSRWFPWLVRRACCQAPGTSNAYTAPPSTSATIAITTRAMISGTCFAMPGRRATP